MLIPEKLDLRQIIKRRKLAYLDTARFPSICSIVYYPFLLSIQIALFDVLSCRVACYAIAVCFEVVMIDDNDGSR